MLRTIAKGETGLYFESDQTLRRVWCFLLQYINYTSSIFSVQKRRLSVGLFKEAFKSAQNGRNEITYTRLTVESRPTGIGCDMSFKTRI